MVKCGPQNSFFPVSSENTAFNEKIMLRENIYHLIFVKKCYYSVLAYDDPILTDCMWACLVKGPTSAILVVKI